MSKLSCPVELKNGHVTCVANEIGVECEICHLQAATLRARFSFTCHCDHGSMCQDGASINLNP